MINTVAEVLGVINLVAGVSNLWKSPICDCHCTFTADKTDSTLIKEVLKYNSENCVPQWYLPWWLIAFIFVIGCVCGAIGFGFVKGAWTTFFERRQEQRREPIAAENQQALAIAPAGLVPVTPKSLRLRDGR